MFMLRIFYQLVKLSICLLILLDLIYSMQGTYGHFLWQGGQTLELNGIYKNCTTIVNGTL